MIAATLTGNYSMGDLLRRLAEYETLFEIGGRLAGTLDVQTVLERALENAEAVCRAETSSIWELDEERQELFFRRHVTLDEMLANIEAVNADDVQRVARDLFVEGRLAATMVGPESSIQLSSDRLRI